jgi:hypothetical protein
MAQFAMQIRGESLHTAFRDVETLVYDPEIVPRTGDLVIIEAYGRGEFPLSRFWMCRVEEVGQNVPELLPCSDIPILSSHCTEIQILGTVVEKWRTHREEWRIHRGSLAFISHIEKRQARAPRQ